jgi:hypothetical protein
MSDALADSTTSLRGMDVVPPSGERTPLLDVESASSASHPRGSGSGLGPRHSESFVVYFPSECIEQQNPALTDKVSHSTFVQRARYYIPSLSWVPNYSYSL